MIVIQNQTYKRAAAVIAAFAVLAGVLAGPACADPAISPDDWGMDDGAGVGTRVAATPCLTSESHQWADPADGSRVALWCPPPAFIWVPAR